MTLVLVGHRLALGLPAPVIRVLDLDLAAVVTRAELGGRCLLSGDNCVKRPGAWDPLELVLASLLKRDVRPSDEILDGARHEHLTRRGRGSDASADVHRKAGHLSIDELA